MPQMRTKIATSQHDDLDWCHLADGQGDRLGNLHDREETGEEGGHGDDQQGRRGDQAALQKHLGDECGNSVSG